MGSAVEGVRGEQSDYGVKKETFANKCEAERVTSEATEWTNSYKSAHPKAVEGASAIMETPPFCLVVSDLILLRLSASGSHGCAVNHRRRGKTPFFRLITYGESTITFVIRSSGDLWMNPSLRGSLKGDLLQRQPQVIYSFPKFAIYFFPPLQPLAPTRLIQTIVALCFKPRNEPWSRPQQRSGLGHRHKGSK